MNISLIQSIILGLVSGLAQMLPISAQAHRGILRYLMGIDSEGAVFRLILHIAALLALIQCSRKELLKLRKTSKLMKIPPRRRKSQPDLASMCTLRLLKTASFPLLFGRLFTLQLYSASNKLQVMAAGLLVNGILLLISGVMPNGNKDSRNMPRLDGILMGVGAGLSVIPGISLVGFSAAIGVSRGVDRKYALKFAYLLLIPGLVGDIVMDLIAIVMGGAASFSGIGFAVALVGGVACFAGCVMGHRLMKILISSTSLSTFSYYCFGAAMFSFVLFLMI